MAEYDNAIISMAQQILGQPKPKSDPPPTELKAHPVVLSSARSPSQPKALPPADAIKVEAETAEMARGKEIRTAVELAQMIEADLAKHPQCPRQGFNVTVYGTTLWRAMLTIAPAAGPVRNPQEWRD